MIASLILFDSSGPVGLVIITDLAVDNGISARCGIAVRVHVRRPRGAGALHGARGALRAGHFLVESGIRMHHH